MFVLDGGRILNLAITATDPDLPANRLTFSLEPGYADGVAIDALTGSLQWTPSWSSADTTNFITVRVIDDGVPPLSDLKTFSVVVNRLNQIAARGDVGR